MAIGGKGPMEYGVVGTGRGWSDKVQMGVCVYVCGFS